MAGVKILTSEDFIEQSIIFDGKKLQTMYGPTTSCEHSLFEALSEKDDVNSVWIGYDNTFVLHPSGVFPFPAASFMHYFLANTLKERMVGERKGQTLVDLGCGSGFLGNYAARNIDALESGRIIFGDLSGNSVNAAIKAYDFNNPSGERSAIEKTPHGLVATGDNFITLDFRVGDAQETMQGEKGDVAVACPIYLPHACEVFPEAYVVFGQVAKNMGADFYFAHSEMANPLIERAANSLNARLEGIDERRFVLDLSTVDSSVMRKGGIDHSDIEKMVGLGLMQSVDQLTHKVRVSKMCF